MTITADFSGGEKTVTTEPLYQWDTGQQLALSGLPATSTDIQVHFANAAMPQAIVKATELVDSLPTCDIPNEFLQFGSAAKARAWVFYRASDTEGYTVRTVLIPVAPRKRPNDYVSPEDPDSQGIVERAMELLENYQADIAQKANKSDMEVAVSSVFNYLNGGTDELTFTATGGITSSLYVEAGNTYLFRDESEHHINGSLYVDGHSQSQYLFQLPADGSPVAYTPQFSGYIRMYATINDNNPAGTVKVRMFDLNSAIGCVKGSAIELTSAQNITNAGISSLAELPPQSISFANYQICSSNSNTQDSPWDGGTGIIMSLTDKQGANIYKSTNWSYQIAAKYASEALHRNEFAFRKRNSDGTYTGWHYFHENGRVFYATPSDFIEVIQKAVSVQDSTVYLQQGTPENPYTLFDSTHDELYWTATARGNSNHPYMGIMLSNHVHLIGLGNVTINANYTGTSQTIRNELSIFNISGDAILENLKLVGENIEYLIHDDSNIVGVSGAYKFTMKNCVLEHNGTVLENGDGAPVCVGGGCSVGKRVIIEDCVLSSVADNRTLIYHSTLNRKANILIKGCIFPLAGNTIHIRNMQQGTTPDMTCVIRDCSLGAPLLLGLMDGITLHEYNNTVSTYEGYVRGTVDRTTGELLTRTYNYRVVQCEIARADVALYVRCADSSYRFAVVTYNADGTLKNYGDYGTSRVIEPGTYYRITIRKYTISGNEDTSQPADVAEFASKVVINKDIVFDYPLTRMPKYMVGAMSYRPLGTLSRGYICFSTDDGRKELATYTIPMFIQKNVPLTMCLWSTSEVMANQVGRNQIIAAITDPKTAKSITITTDPDTHEEVWSEGSVINAGYSHSKSFEVAQHGNDPWADGILNAGRPDDGREIHTPFDEKSLYDFWESENAAFAAQGITVARAAACPYGYTNQRMIAQAGGYFGVHRSVYNPDDDHIVMYEKYCTGPRSNIFALRAANIKNYSLNYWKQVVDYAIAHNYLLCIYFHDFDLDGVQDGLTAAQILEGTIDYAKQQGITFCNLSDIPHLT